jgi:hypothetical protein
MNVVRNTGKIMKFYIDVFLQGGHKFTELHAGAQSRDARFEVLKDLAEAGAAFHLSYGMEQGFVPRGNVVLICKRDVEDAS